MSEATPEQLDAIRSQLAAQSHDTIAEGFHAVMQLGRAAAPLFIEVFAATVRVSLVVLEFGKDARTLEGGVYALSRIVTEETVLTDGQIAFLQKLAHAKGMPNVKDMAAGVLQKKGIAPAKPGKPSKAHALFDQTERVRAALRSDDLTQVGTYASYFRHASPAEAVAARGLLDDAHAALRFLVEDLARPNAALYAQDLLRFVSRALPHESADAELYRRFAASANAKLRSEARACLKAAGVA